MKTAVTIKDIAEQLGLSRNTVAKALNGQYVPETTRTLILNKARELNYKSINATESAGVPHKSKRILLLSGKPLNNLNFFVPIIKSIENYCYTHHHELFQYTFIGNVMNFTSFMEYAKSLNVDGILAIETFDKDFISKLVNLGMPICFIDFAPTSSIPITGNYDIIKTSDSKPIFSLVRQLLRNHDLTRFCFVGDITHCMSFQDRYFGMMQALSLDGIPHSRREDILRSDMFDYGSITAIKSEILKLRNVPECFVCANDFIARSVCNTLGAMQIDVPRQCFVIGYDNVAESYSATPTITSFGCDKECLGTEAISALLNRIDYAQYTYTRTITVHVKTVLRTSTER